ncbi:YciI family protein [Psychromarinibacter sp. C21-152]|uniref:YciI family protein n=1 Tax=Psychromarinibacter sediminicola TaxID=3033385 RepID=A0AAE3T8E1_9RHOB|nr:YciI family protein [Psychromarinibacter sediminicola]MDF0601177.1 YciI family protein [Psychromarinibacter sediminicola]
MPNFMFIYHGGKTPETPEEGEKVMAEWNAWYQSMGDKVVHGGGPAGPSKTVSAQGIAGDGGANPVSGLTLVEAADQAAACEMAKGCPMVQDGSGSVEVAEMIEM